MNDIVVIIALILCWLVTDMINAYDVSFEVLYMGAIVVSVIITTKIVYYKYKALKKHEQFIKQIEIAKQQEEETQKKIQAENELHRIRTEKQAKETARQMYEGIKKGIYLIGFGEILGEKMYRGNPHIIKFCKLNKISWETARELSLLIGLYGI